MSDIIIDEDKFKKIVKKLTSGIAKHMVDKSGLVIKADGSRFDGKLQHSLMLDVVSESFGFNNYHAIQCYFKKEEGSIFPLIKSVKNKECILLGDKDALKSFIKDNLILTPTDSLSIWVSRAIILLDISTDLFFHRVDNEIGFDCTMDNLRLCFNLDVLLEYIKNGTDKVIVELLEGYVRSLPGAKDEQHGYLQMQFIKIFGSFKNLDCNMVILTSDLFYTKNSNYHEYVYLYSSNDNNGLKELIIDIINARDLVLNDLFVIYKDAMSVKQRKSIVEVYNYIMYNRSIVKKILM